MAARVIASSMEAISSTASAPARQETSMSSSSSRKSFRSTDTPGKRLLDPYEVIEGAAEVVLLREDRDAAHAALRVEARLRHRVDARRRCLRAKGSGASPRRQGTGSPPKGTSGAVAGRRTARAPMVVPLALDPRCAAAPRSCAGCSCRLLAHAPWPPGTRADLLQLLRGPTRGQRLPRPQVAVPDVARHAADVQRGARVQQRPRRGSPSGRRPPSTAMAVRGVLRRRAAVERRHAGSAGCRTPPG